MSPATAGTYAAPFAGDCHAQRTEKQDFDAHEGKHLGSAEHLIARVGGQLRLRLLCGLGLGLRRLVRGSHGTGGRKRAEGGAAARGILLCGNRPGQGEQGEDDGQHCEPAAARAGGDCGMERRGGQTSN